MNILNKARIDYDIKYPHNPHPIHNTKFSNEVCTIVKDDILLISKEVDKKTASIFDNLNYTVTIRNLTHSALTNLWFIDSLSPALKFIPGSVCINGKTEHCLNPQKGFQVSILPPLETITIIFVAVICSEPAGKQVKNCAKLRIDYSSSPFAHSIPITFKSNQTVTRIFNNLFKQINIGTLIPVPKDIYKTHKVANVTPSVRVINSKIVKSPVKRLPGNPNIPVVLLIVTGCIDFNIKYEVHSSVKLRCDYGKEKRKVDMQSTMLFGFSDYMFVPAAIQYCPEKFIRTQVEDFLYISSENDIFSNVCVLMSLQANSKLNG